MICVKIIFLISSLVLSIVTSRFSVFHRGVATFDSNKGAIFQDLVLNFFGAMIGYLSLYYLIFHQIGLKVDVYDLVLIFISYVGITGYLPHLVVNKGLKP